MEAGHLLVEHVRVAAVPPVGQDHDDRAARHAALTPLVVEVLEPVSQSGAAAVVEHAHAGATQRVVRIAG